MSQGPADDVSIVLWAQDSHSHINDIDHLRDALGMPLYPYVDFSTIQTREKALKRWALLQEWHACLMQPVES